MYISDKCVFTPYTSDFSLDEQIDDLLASRASNHINDLIKFLKKNNNYGLDEVFRVSKETTDYDLAEYIARQGYALDYYVNYTYYTVRRAVAEQGYGLDILVNDDNENVLLAVVEQGYGLDKIFAKTDDSYILIELIKQNYKIDEIYEKAIKENKENVLIALTNIKYKLNELITYDNEDVRAAVARQGYGLDKLINDSSEYVRAAVAEQGYYLDKLINDSSGSVRNRTTDYLKDNTITLLTWYNKNPDKCYYKSFHDIFNDNRVSGHCAYDLIKDNMYLDYLLKKTDYKSETRQKIIELGYNNLKDWIINYPDNVYYTEVLKELGIKPTKKKSSKSKNENSKSEEVKKIEEESKKVTQDFVVKINDSKTLSVDDSIEEFFASEIDTSDLNNNILTIITVDTKMPLIKIEKANVNDKKVFKFIVDITTEDEDNFSFKTFIKTQDQLNKLIEQTVDALSNYPQFSKYLDDLKNSTV